MTSAVKVFTVFFALLLLQCKSEVKLNGFAMGTTWSVRAVTDIDSATLEDSVKKEIERVEDIFSNWREQSELSRFNKHQSTTPFAVSRDFYIVMNVALQVARDSNGAFDPAISELIEQAGFGVSKGSTKAVAANRNSWKKISVTESSGKYYLQKSDPAITLNLSAVAKGYAVDAVYLILKLKKIDNFLVEIGGEVRSAGLSRSEKPWRVGIEEPDPDAHKIHSVLEISEMSVATSGGYRNFKKDKNKTSIHILDPHSGQSVQNDILSVSIISPNCTYADALATAVMVMGKEKGLQMLKNYRDTDALILYREGDSVKELSSAGMKNYLENSSSAK